MAVSAPTPPTTRGEFVIEATDIVKRYGHVTALAGASLQVRPGEVLALVGDNGAGKSTLTKIICGALAPDEGRLSFWGKPTSIQAIGQAQALGVETVYQDLALAPDLSVAENMFLGREPVAAGWFRRWPAPLDRRRMRAAAQEALRGVGINLESVDRTVRELSGGQRQAIAVARAVMWATAAILMDEPTAALGTKQTGIVYDAIRSAAERGLAVVVVSHDIPKMLSLADRIAVLRQGRTVANIPARELNLTDVVTLMLGGAGHGARGMSPVEDTATPPANRAWLSRLAGGTRSTPFGMALIVIALILVFGVLSPNYAFLRVSNLTTMTLNVSVAMLLAVGITLVLAAGELDLSIGANVVLSSVVAAKVLVAVSGTSDQVRVGDYPDLPLGLVAACVAGIVTGTLFGLVNGLLVTRLRITSFIVTLGTLGIGTGLAYVLTSGTNVPYVPRVIQTGFGMQKLFGIVPYPMIIVLLVAALLWYTLNATRFGLHTLAIGSSREAAERAGIRSRGHVLTLFVIMGALAGVASLLDLTRFATTNIGGHQTTALAAIAAVVIGGTSLFGGRATIAGSMIGSLIPVVLGTGLVILGVPAFYQLIVVGVILIVAVFVDQRRRERLS